MRFLRTLAIAVVLVLVWSIAAQAQAQTKPAQFVQLTVTTVRPSAINDYEDFLKKQNAARDKTPGSPRVVVYAVNLGGPGFTFYAFTGFEKWADREKFPNGGEMMTKVYGQAEAARLQKIQRDAITQQRSEVFAYNANSSLNPKVNDPPAAFMNLQRNELQPELAAAYATAMTKTKNAQEAAGDKRTIMRRNSVQGAGFVNTVTTYFAKLGDRDLPNPNLGEALRKMYGDAEAAQIQDISNRAIRNRQQIFLGYRADLSHPKATVSSSN
jgi:hypothetical protein